jgi:hypothetical protein
MEQGLVDTSKYKVTLVSIDTRFATQKNAVNSTFRIGLPFTMRNVMRVRMASLELPLVEHVFSAYKGNVSFEVRIKYDKFTTKVGPIPDGNDTVGELCALLDRLLKGVNPDFTCSLDPVSNRIVVKNTGILFRLYMSSDKSAVGERATHWGLGYYLGFRDREIMPAQADGVYTTVAVAPPSLKPTPYYLMQLKCPEQAVNLYHPGVGPAYIEAFAKVILKEDHYTTQFDDNSNMLRKEYTFLSPTAVPFFEVTLLDPWGVPVNMMDADWSMTLEVTEVVNSKTYDNLLTTYQRR